MFSRTALIARRVAVDKYGDVLIPRFTRLKHALNVIAHYHFILTVIGCEILFLQGLNIAVVRDLFVVVVAFVTEISEAFVRFLFDAIVDFTLEALLIISAHFVELVFDPTVFAFEYKVTVCALEGFSICASLSSAVFAN